MGWGGGEDAGSVFVYLCVMCECTNAFTHVGNMGTGWVGSCSGSERFSLVVHGSHGCLAPDGPSLDSCAVS